MSQFFACKDNFSLDCDWTICAETKSEVMSEVTKHAKSEHLIDYLSDKMIGDVNHNLEEI